jgi:hypothetical protein
MEDIAVRKINVRKYREFLGINENFEEEESRRRE